MAGEGIAGHGTIVHMEIELDPVMFPGVLTLTPIAELMDITYPTLTTNVFETTPQDVVGIADEWAIGSVFRGSVTFAVNFVFDGLTHDHLTGLIALVNTGALRLTAIRGPGGIANVDEWEMNCFTVGVNETAPVRTGVRSADITLQPTGSMDIDGATLDGT